MILFWWLCSNSEWTDLGSYNTYMKVHFVWIKWDWIWVLSLFHLIFFRSSGKEQIPIYSKPIEKYSTCEGSWTILHWSFEQTWFVRNNIQSTFGSSRAESITCVNSSWHRFGDSQRVLLKLLDFHTWWKSTSFWRFTKGVSQNLAIFTIGENRIWNNVFQILRPKILNLHLLIDRHLNPSSSLNHRSTYRGCQIVID